jgi:hypothetical protein
MRARTSDGGIAEDDLPKFALEGVGKKADGDAKVNVYVDELLRKAMDDVLVSTSDE